MLYETPVSIDEYFQSQIALLSSLPFVISPQVGIEKRADTVGFIRGVVEFSDGSQLHYRELVDMRQPMRLVMYAYHYQDARNNLVFRYDNTAHHMQVQTFPHHKHSGKIILSSQPPSLETVLAEIETVIASDER